MDTLVPPFLSVIGDEEGEREARGERERERRRGGIFEREGGSEREISCVFHKTSPPGLAYK